MPDVPKRLAVMRKLVAILETVSFETDDGAAAVSMTGKVHRGRAIIGGETLRPYLTLLESNRPDQAPQGGGDNKIAYESLWTLLLQGFVPDQARFPTDPAYWLSAACEVALSRVILQERGRPTYPDDFMLGKLIAGLAIGPGVVRPADREVSSTAYFYLPLIVNLTVNVAKPHVPV